MNSSFDYNFKCSTNGSGYWSSISKEIPCTKLELNYISEEETHGELLIYFNEIWDTNKDGLIYTDKLFIKNLHEFLKKIGFSVDAYKSVSYSEYGMQGFDYVSFDVNGSFIKEFKKLEMLYN